MLTTDLMRIELDRLSSEAIAQIYDALHDLKDSAIHEAAMACLWQRHGHDVNEWPLNYHSSSLIGYCSAGADHVPVRHLFWEYDLGSKMRKFWEWTCSCGRSTSATALDQKLYIKWRQIRATCRVWPVVVRDGIPHYRVCRYSSTAEDAYHAPTGELACMCVCGTAMNPVEDKYLPAY